MGTRMAGEHEWDWPTIGALDALGRINRGERRRWRWVRWLERRFGVST